MRNLAKVVGAQQRHGRTRRRSRCNPAGTGRARRGRPRPGHRPAPAGRRVRGSLPPVGRPADRGQPELPADEPGDLGHVPVHGRLGAFDPRLQHVGAPGAVSGGLDHGEPGGADDRRVHLGRRPAPRADLPAEPHRRPGRRSAAGRPDELYEHCITRQPFYAQDAVFNDGHEPGVRRHHRLPADGTSPDRRPASRGGPAAVPATRRSRTRPRRPSSPATSGSTTPAATRCSRSPWTPPRSSLGGHQIWQSNPLGCGTEGSRRGPPAGAVDDESRRHAAAGPEPGSWPRRADLLRTSTGLWIASDNQANTDACGTEAQHQRMGICFLPND